jgi:heme-degrading monooxygenase HmoA
MLIAIVQVPGIERTKEQAIAAATGSAPTFAKLPGLIRKYYLNGENGGGGVYLWESREAADAWYNKDWSAMMEKRFGAKPTLTYYDNYVVLDNSSSELRVDGAPAKLGG